MTQDSVNEAVTVDAVLALGSNMGDRLAHLTAARDAIHETPGIDVRRSSRVFMTAPVGGPAQDDFLNACLLIATTLTPPELLRACHDVERSAHRVRLERWGPRTLDVDIVTIDGYTSTDPELTVPHPRAHLRAFVLVPWAEVQPTATLEVSQEPAVNDNQSQAGKRSPRQPVTHLVADLARSADDFSTVIVADQQWAPMSDNG